MTPSDTQAVLSPRGQISIEFPCRKGCERVFASAPARNTHEIRKHGKNWDTSKNFRRINRLRRKGVKWTPAQHKKYKATMAAKRNGVTPQPQTIDSMGDAARAVMVAAQVLRAVSIGIKL